MDAEVRPAQPLALEPDPALAELLEAIRQGGQEAYRRLLEVLRELKTLEPGSEISSRRSPSSPASRGGARERGRLRGRAVDPETLTHSKAALAQALVRQGLVRGRCAAAATGCRCCAG